MPTKSSTKLQLEVLERRYLLATVSWTAGVVTIMGTELADALVFRSDGSDYVVDGTDARIPQDQAQRLEVHLLGGDDLFRNDTALRSTVFGGTGHDFLTGGAGNDELYGEEGNDRLDGAGFDLLSGGEGNDLLLGSTQLDHVAWVGNYLTLHGTPHDDRLLLRQDGDQFYVVGMHSRWATPAQVSVYGQSGNDRLFNLSNVRGILRGGAGHDIVHGGTSAETIEGDAGNDFLIGGGGNDWLHGGAGHDSLHGSLGDDIYVLRVVSGPVERDSIADTAGTDTLDFGGHTSPVMLTFDGHQGHGRHAGRVLRVESAAAEIILGGKGNDLLQGSPYTQRIEGNRGDDTLIGSDGGQLLRGGDGNDSLTGGDGDDQLDGGRGNDVLDGGPGDDHFLFETAYKAGEVDRLLDEGGNNTLDFSKSTRDLTLRTANTQDFAVDTYRRVHRTPQTTNGLFSTILGASATNDIVASGDVGSRIIGGGTIVGTSGDDYIEGGSGGDALYGGAGNDTLVGLQGNDILHGEDGDDLLVGNGGGDRLEGGTGRDEIWGGNAPYPSTEVPTSPDSDRDDILLGGLGDDFLAGAFGNDNLSGGDGNDVLDGGNGNDTLNGNRGDDVISGGQGNDIFAFDASEVVGEVDHLRDSAGANMLDFRANNEPLQIDTAAVLGLAVDPRRTVHRTLEETNGDFTIIYGGHGDDTIIAAGDVAATISAGNGNNVVTGSAGDDYIVGGAQRDIIDGGAGHDQILGGGGEDSLLGSSGNDYILGGAQRDIIDGGAGHDQIFGVGGDDWLLGGEGNDRLVGSSGADRLEGGAGNDILFGGDPTNSSQVVIPYPLPPTASSHNHSIPYVLPPPHGDLADILLGGPGSDRLIGNAGQDELDGGADADILYPGDDLIGLIVDDGTTKFG